MEAIAMYTLVAGIAGLGFGFIMDVFRDAVANAQKTSLNDICIKIVIGLFKVKSKLEMIFGHLYSTYPFIRECTDRSMYAVNFVTAKAKGYSIEPYGNNWISMSTIEETNKQLLLGDQYVYSEKYHYINPGTNPSLAVNDFYKQCLEHTCEIAKSRCKVNVMETLVTMKVFDNYLHAAYFNVDNAVQSEYVLPAVTGRRQFLSIEYTHPHMKSGIVIDIPDNMYCNTSCILTPVFIQRYLSHQDKLYFFDMNYVLKIMDTNINTITLKSNQYIKLTERSYSVITVYPMNNEAVINENRPEVDRPEVDDELLPDDGSDADEMPALIAIGEIAAADLAVENLQEGADDDETTRENYTYDQEYPLEVEM
jgi:hypothetical protein